MSAVDAHEQAGYSRNEGNAGRLNRNEQVLRRVEEIKSRASAKTEVTLQWLLDQAIEVLVLAKQNGQTGPAVSAIKELGVLSGHRVEKRENTNRNANDLSDDELADIIRASSGDSAEAARSSTKPH